MQNKYTFIKVDLSKIDHNQFLNFPDKTVFTTIEWITFIANDSNVNPLIIQIQYKQDIIGFFSSLHFSKLFVKIIASPFPGWSTPYMGLDLLGGTNRLEIIKELVQFLFETEKCHYIRITDRLITLDETKKAKINYNTASTLELKIDISDEALFKNMKTDCRNYIRQFERRGARIEIAKPDIVFANEYYEQLKDVFAKQKLVPNYSLSKVVTLLSSLAHSDNILCLRVLNPAGTSIATSIFVGYGKKFFFWGGASYRDYQHYRPNEYMIWTAIKYWRERSFEIFDMVGVRSYKKKFGPTEESFVALIFPKYKVLWYLEKFAGKLFYFKIKLLGKMKRAN
ncbi:MAG: GNAT family N-acetyltransferase [Bacteroidia bacterium]|nr:GNAT family N-acetyltransferase [Bacteroidia bacterium]